MDFAQKQGNKFLILVDDHSKFPCIFILQETKAKDVINILRGLYANFGLIEELVSDNRPPFNSEELAQFYHDNLTTQKFSPVAHPNSNGTAERQVKNCKDTLVKQLNDPVTSQ
jgi:transposase InsO family protein